VVATLRWDGRMCSYDGVSVTKIVGTLSFLMEFINHI